MGAERLPIEADELDERLSKMDVMLNRDLHRGIVGRTSGLRHAVLSSVVDGNYDAAINELRMYEDLNSTFPIFKLNTERYFAHCEELIRAIDSKVKFSESKSITRTQKQDLHSMVRKHFRTLADSLRQIETIENNIRVQDLRSTIWILKAFSFSVFLLLSTMAAIEIKATLLRPLLNVLDVGVFNLVRMIFS